MLILTELADISQALRTKNRLIDFVEDRGYEAVEFQNEDYDPKEDTVSRLSEECGYFTVKDLPDVSEEL